VPALCQRGRITEYERFSSFYDMVMDDPGPRADRVAEWIGRYRPGSESLLELGCGTGAILARLIAIPYLTGLDRSPEMLAVAREKVPGARLVEGDMRGFSLDERYDVVICVFDSLNHLLSFEEWQSVFDAVHAHLVDDGLFLFDVNTVGELRRLGEEPPWVYDFDEGVAIIDVSFAEDEASDGISSWDIRIFEQMGGDRFQLHREQIGELAVSLALIRSTLQDRFELLEEVGDDGEPPTDGSIKGHFAYRRRA
jgi:SAM-dependent methyltransferase